MSANPRLSHANCGLIRRTAAVGIPAIRVRRSGADKEEGGIVVSNSYFRELGGYNGGSKTDIRSLNSRVYP